MVLTSLCRHGCLCVLLCGSVTTVLAGLRDTIELWQSCTFSRSCSFAMHNLDGMQLDPHASTEHSIGWHLQIQSGRNGAEVSQPFSVLRVLMPFHMNQPVVSGRNQALS
jgi:hypothetical protein